MIDRDYYEGYFGICDACDDVTEENYPSFQDAVDGMRAEGWKSVKIGTDWMNYCPVCAAKYARPGANEFAGI